MGEGVGFETTNVLFYNKNVKFKIFKASLCLVLCFTTYRFAVFERPLHKHLFDNWLHLHVLSQKGQIGTALSISQNIDLCVPFTSNLVKFARALIQSPNNVMSQTTFTFSTVSFCSV